MNKSTNAKCKIIIAYIMACDIRSQFSFHLRNLNDNLSSNLLKLKEFKLNLSLIFENDLKFYRKETQEYKDALVLYIKTLKLYKKMDLLNEKDEVTFKRIEKIMNKIKVTDNDIWGNNKEKSRQKNISKSKEKQFNENNFYLLYY